MAIDAGLRFIRQVGKGVGGVYNQHKNAREYARQNYNRSSPLGRGKQKQVKSFYPVCHDALNSSIKGQRVLKCTNYMQNIQKNTCEPLKLFFRLN